MEAPMSRASQRPDANQPRQDSRSVNNAPGPLRADRRSNLFPAPLRPSLSFSCSGFAYSAEGDNTKRAVSTFFGLKMRLKMTPSFFSICWDFGAKNLPKMEPKSDSNQTWGIFSPISVLHAFRDRIWMVFWRLGTFKIELSPRREHDFH